MVRPCRASTSALYRVLLKVMGGSSRVPGWYASRLKGITNVSPGRACMLPLRSPAIPTRMVNVDHLLDTFKPSFTQNTVSDLSYKEYEIY
jgi:hypothetical protein